MRPQGGASRSHVRFGGSGLLILVFVVVAAFVSTGLDQEIYFDEAYYYSYLSSIATDFDLDLTDDLLHQRIGFVDWRRMAFEHTSTGAVDNKFSIGPALFWLPVFVPFHLALGAVSTVFPGIPSDGFSLPYRILLIGGTYCLTLYSQIRLLQWLRRTYLRPNALVAVIAGLLGTFWIYYVVSQPLYAHALSISLSTLLLLEWHDRAEQYPFVPSDALIFLSSTVVLVRWQNAVLVAALFVYSALRPSGSGPARSRPSHERGLVRWPLLALLGFVPQIAVWLFQSGNPLTIPQGDGFLRFDSLKVVPLLISSWHGLFGTHPILVLGLVGLLRKSLRRDALGIVFVLAFIPMTLLNASVDDWWAGASFGMRRFDSLLPLFIIGLAEALSVIRGKWLRAVAGLAVSAGVVLNLVHLSLFSQLYIHRGLPLDGQISLVIENLKSWADLGGVLLPVRSPVGAVLSWGIGPDEALLRWLPILVCVFTVGMWVRRASGRHRRLSPTWQRYALIALTLVWSVVVLLSAIRTSRTDLASLSLAKSLFSLGETDAPLLLLDTVKESGYCDARFLELDIWNLRDNEAKQAEVTREILNECDSIGWYYIATSATGQSAVATRAAASVMLAKYAPWHPHASGLNLALARAELYRGNWTGAQSYYKWATHFNPLNSAAWLESAWLSRARGETSTALVELGHVHGFGRASALSQGSEVSAFQGDFEGARELLSGADAYIGGDPALSIAIAEAALRQREPSGAIGHLRTAINARPPFGLGHWYPLGELILGDAWLGMWSAEGAVKNAAACRAAISHIEYAGYAYLKYSMLSAASAELAVMSSGDARVPITNSIRLVREALKVEMKSLEERERLVETLTDEGATEQVGSLLRATTAFYHPRTGLSQLPQDEVLAAESEVEVARRKDVLSEYSGRLSQLEQQIGIDRLLEAAGSFVPDTDLYRAEMRRVVSDLTPYEYWWTPRDPGWLASALVEASACADRQRDALQWSLEAYGRRALTSEAVLTAARGDAFPDLGTEAAELRRVALREPGNYWIHLELGRSLGQSGQYLEAIESTERAISLAPGFAIAYVELARLYEHLGEAVVARNLLLQAEQLEPGWFWLYTAAAVSQENTPR